MLDADDAGESIVRIPEDLKKVQNLRSCASPATTQVLGVLNVMTDSPSISH